MCPPDVEVLRFSAGVMVGEDSWGQGGQLQPERWGQQGCSAAEKWLKAAQWKNDESVIVNIIRG